jgi:hypothetical protein
VPRLGNQMMPGEGADLPSAQFTNAAHATSCYGWEGHFEMAMRGESKTVTGRRHDHG